MINRKHVGFDRFIRLDWLDACAFAVADGLNLEEIDEKMNIILEGHLSSNGDRNPRDKAKTILFKVWVKSFTEIQPMKREAIYWLSESDRSERIALHLGMSLVNYPFVYDVISIVGRLLSLQEGFTLEDVRSRIFQLWGDRPTVFYSVAKLLGTLNDWGIIQKNGRRGQYSPGTEPICIRPILYPWLVEALLRATGDKMIPFSEIRRQYSPLSARGTIFPRAALFQRNSQEYR